MAARRLVIVLVVMLMLSTFAAVLVPVREDTETSTDSTTTTEQVANSNRNRLLNRSIDTTATKPETVRMELGDTLTLRVRVNGPTEVAIPRLDEIEDADKLDPALFDLLPFEAGKYRVTNLETGELLGTVEVVDKDAKQARPRKA